MLLNWAVCLHALFAHSSPLAGHLKSLFIVIMYISYFAHLYVNVRLLITSFGNIVSYTVMPAKLAEFNWIERERERERFISHLLTAAPSLFIHCLTVCAALRVHAGPNEI